MYFIKTPWFLKRFYGSYHWDIPTAEKKIFLSFDDGPHPEATPFVLDTLHAFNARATFFCLGKNIISEPALYKRILAEGHQIGNHTHDHLNGWQTDLTTYLHNVHQAAQWMDASLFRPPYGRITKHQGRALIKKDYKIIMWDVLSGDFDPTITPDECLRRVVKKTRPGSIVVFHDSQKAFKNLRHALPGTLAYFSKQGYIFEPLSLGLLQKAGLG